MDERAGGDESQIQAMEKDVAEIANSDRAESIVRRLRERRKYRLKTNSDGGSVGHPPPGFGTFASDLGDYAKRLEDELTRVQKQQRMSRHRVALMAAQASRLREIAEERLAYLRSVEDDDGASIKPFLKGIGDIEPSLDPVSFVDAERRQVDLILMVSERVMNKAEVLLDFL